MGGEGINLSVCVLCCFLTVTSVLVEVKGHTMERDTGHIVWTPLSPYSLGGTPDP